MHVHIIGICGTFMGGIAAIAKEAGYTVTGMDQHVYPPMSDALVALGIDVSEGYDVADLPKADIYLIGNTISRGNPVLEHLLRESLPITSGPQWLHETVLKDRWVLAVAGTHGKTTTSSMLAWILEANDHSSGFLIGGMPNNFDVTARLGASPFFVIEADEYDTAFFDKRSKFVHYFPKTAILNNLEFDHADIFDDLAAIQKQFFHLVRIIADNGCIVRPQQSDALDAVIEKGCFTPLTYFSLADNQANWYAVKKDNDTVEFLVHGESIATVPWTLPGDYNLENALAACAAAEHIGVKPADAINAMLSYTGVKRRQEIYGQVNGVTIYDDFAHHPTAIRKTLDGFRQKIGTAPMTVVFEPRSNTMKRGVHKDTLAASFNAANRVVLFQSPEIQWSLKDVARDLEDGVVYDEIQKIIDDIVESVSEEHHIVIMSNGGFGGLHKKLLDALTARSTGALKESAA
ncbi:MAG: UDP-N-acetylmuramate:L-alanyl-gamma-D-glutamyl-meso-diaminopimelate ligase [Gammaproteobacteria bacterium]|nr:UDP-N-acetylmuramate:L-alanyl-gamma-D-glutamyl-meso-diaminopimelate ligase [Gammaproteobacteria bacterium]